MEGPRGMRERGDEGRKREGPKEEGIIGPEASLPAAESDYQLWFRMINRGRLTNKMLQYFTIYILEE